MRSPRGNFLSAVAGVLEHEGGYVWDPDDPGGETNFGITKRTYPDLDIRNLTVEDARDIYFHDFWYPLRLVLFSEPVAAKLLDMAVNFSPKTFALIVQTACRALGKKIEMDGVWGPKTRGAILQLDEEGAPILDGMCWVQAATYLQNIRISPRKVKWESGWLARAFYRPS
jgi:lysozyme family protein